MNESAVFTIGSEVVCTDDACGALRSVVVDPVARTLTHLVVEPHHRPGLGRLVPVALVVSAGPAEIRLSCSTSEFRALEDAVETQFLPSDDTAYGYEQGQVLAMPYYGLAMGGMGMGMHGTGNVSPAVTYDRVPLGEVEIRHGDHVNATDGPIGQVQGLVIDPSDHHVTHVLLDEGHLWGKKQVAIPITDVETADDGVRLKLTKDQVRDLAPVDLSETK
jgi:hypothetical protein